MGTRGRVVDAAVPGQLVRLLPVLPPALPVALAGQAAVPGAGPAGQPEREGEVDERRHRVGTLRVLLRTPAGDDDRALGPSQGVDRRVQVLGRYPAQPLDSGRPPGGGDLRDLVPTRGTGGDVGPVDVPFGDRDVQQSERDRQVGTGRGLQVQRGPACGLGTPWIDDDQRPVLRLLGEVPAQRRHGLRHVRADQQQGVRPAQVGQRERQPPVDPERADPGRRRRRHAEAPVVVDVTGTEDGPRELAQRVRLLVGQPTAPEDGDRVAAVRRLQLADPARHEVQRDRPGDRLAV